MESFSTGGKRIETHAILVRKGSTFENASLAKSPTNDPAFRGHPKLFESFTDLVVIIFVVYETEICKHRTCPADFLWMDGL